jgi:hypothetical protein
VSETISAVRNSAEGEPSTDFAANGLGNGLRPLNTELLDSFGEAGAVSPQDITIRPAPARLPTLFGMAAALYGRDMKNCNSFKTTEEQITKLTSPNEVASVLTRARRDDLTLRVCAWCNPYQLPADIKQTHGMCPECFKAAGGKLP